jgi:hypothetical protein
MTGHSLRELGDRYSGDCVESEQIGRVFLRRMRERSWIDGDRASKRVDHASFIETKSDEAKAKYSEEKNCTADL